MSNELLAAAALLWAASCVAVLARAPAGIGRVGLALGCALAIVAAAIGLPAGTATNVTVFSVAGQSVACRFTPDALWLLGFGLAPAGLAVLLGSPNAAGQRGWQFGAALCLLGALGVFGLQDAAALLVAWEMMSLGAAVMLLAERLGPGAGSANLFMLALLEVGSVALLLALLLLARHAGSPTLSGFATSSALSGPAALGIGVLLLIGFGAKLGVLPFYEWVPRAYGTGSGASGAVLSGVVLNAAYFGLARGVIEWLPAASPSTTVLGTIVIAAGVFSAVLAILYAFQQDDWRSLLAFSTAENAAIAVTMLGAAVLFRQDGQSALAALAWIVALLHLAGHALAKGAMFLAADGAYLDQGSYHIAQSGLLRRSAWPLGIGALFAAMSLAALPPQAGFVSEWFAFQTLFQTVNLSTLGGRLTLALAGAGLALTAAIALATFVKVFGLGLLGDGAGNGNETRTGAPRGHAGAVLVLGLAVLALAVGMLHWIDLLGVQSLALFGVDAAARSHSGWILVPLRADFAFISPALLVIVMPLLALLPLALLLNLRRHPIRRAPVWWGGMAEDPAHSATTALSFSNAMRTFYDFVYRPVLHSSAEHNGPQPYFVRRLIFNYRVAPLFGSTLFTPATRTVTWLAGKFRWLQSGDLNFYLALIGLLLLGILALGLV